MVDIKSPLTIIFRFYLISHTIENYHSATQWSQTFSFLMQISFLVYFLQSWNLFLCQVLQKLRKARLMGTRFDLFHIQLEGQVSIKTQKLLRWVRLCGLLTLKCHPLCSNCIHLIPKWLPFKYSFVFIQISP